MKALLQTGSSGRVPMPHEKRFLITTFILLLLYGLTLSILAYTACRLAGAVLWSLAPLLLALVYLGVRFVPRHPVKAGAVICSQSLLVLIFLFIDNHFIPFKHIHADEYNFIWTWFLILKAFKEAFIPGIIITFLGMFIGGIALTIDFRVNRSATGTLNFKDAMQSARAKYSIRAIKIILFVSIILNVSLLVLLAGNSEVNRRLQLFLTASYELTMFVGEEKILEALDSNDPERIESVKNRLRMRIKYRRPQCDHWREILNITPPHQPKKATAGD